MSSIRQARPRHARPLSGLGYEDQEQRINNQTHMRLDGGVGGNQFSRPATPSATQPLKVDIREGVKRLPHGEHNSDRRPRSSIWAPIIAFFKRGDGKNTVAKNTEQVGAVDVHPEIAQLRREISTLKRRFANLEDVNHSVYGSCQPSSSDIPRGLRKPYGDSLSEYSDCKPATMDVIMQANVTPLEMDSRTAPAPQGQVVQVQTQAEGRIDAEDMDPALQPHMPPRAAKVTSSSPTLHQNQDGVALITPDTTPLVRTGQEEGLSETDKVSSVQPSHTEQEKLPRKEDKELDAGVEAQAGYIAQERLPRKKEVKELGAEVEVEVEVEVVVEVEYIAQERLPRKKQRNEECEVESLPLRVCEERLPRKKENDETNGSRLG